MSLTIQFIPHLEIEKLSSQKRIQKLLKIVKDEKVVLLEGKLRAQEEAELIRKTMEDIDEKFKGIELSVIYPNAGNEPFFTKVKSVFVNMLLGDRSGFSIIGPASVIKEIKQDPNKIQLLTQDVTRKKGK